MSNFTALTILASPSITLSLSLPTGLILPKNFTRTPTTTASIPSPTKIGIQHNTYGDCGPQPTGYGPLPTDDSIESFYSSPAIHDLSALAPAPKTPTNYTRVFSLAEASYTGSTYLGHFELHAYSPEACATRCNTYDSVLNKLDLELTTEASISSSPETPEQLCKGFNIYFERSPSIHLGPECKTASSRTLIKCALWGEGLRKVAVNNRGYKEWDFDVVIAGSNGYHLERFGEDKVGEKTGEEGEGEKSVASHTVILGLGVTTCAFLAGFAITWIIGV